MNLTTNTARFPHRQTLILWAAVLALLSADANAGTLTVKTNKLGATPNLLAYNSAHFYPGSNTREWWRYSGVTGARLFLSAGLLDSSQDITASGSGVTSQATFLSRKAAVRANPLSTTYINWPTITNYYAVAAYHGANLLQPAYALSQLRQAGVQILVNITASQGTFVISSASDWTGKWELWQFYYAQAFYLARGWDVQRYQMYNEPDLNNSIAQTNYLPRLQLVSDAVQCALADVNSLYGKSLVPSIHAPVDTTSSYNSWAQLVVTNRHQNFLGQTDSSFWLLHNYDYHQYNSSPVQFGSNLAALRSALASAMAPEPAFPSSISEFNVHTAGVFDTIPDTLDYPTQYPNLGAIAVNLVQNAQSELYCFKFGQTVGDPGNTYPLRKNGMHYIDNNNAPYNIGGVTKAGEVWRLFNRAFVPGRDRIAFTADSSLNNLTLMASYDPAARRYYVFSVNNSVTATPLTVDVSALAIQNSNCALIQEVSEGSYGAVTHYAQVTSGQVPTFTQPANSVWLITIPAAPQQFVSPGVPTLLTNASDDATVKDGANKNANYGAQTSLVVRNDPANPSNRSAALLKFHLPAINFPNLQLAVLSVYGSTLSVNTTAQAYVYGLTNNSWSQGAITWATAPNLRQGIAAGNHIANNVISGLGDSAFLQGQLVFSSTAPVEQQIDVTDFIRTCTNYDATFLISQDPRWDLTLPSLTDGDTQPDGIQIVSLEGAGSSSPPRLKLVSVNRPVTPSGLTATPQSASQINLTWTDNSTNETGFIVASSTNSGGPYVNLATVPANTTNSSSQGLLSDTTYYYVVRATSPQGDSPNSAEATATTLATNPQPPVIIGQPQSLLLLAGQSAVFSVTATGSSLLQYQWRLNGVSIDGATASALAIPFAAATNAGAYTVLVTNRYGSVLSLNAILGLTTVTAVGDNSFGQCVLPPSATNVIAIAAGAWHNLALRADGAVVAWGNDLEGQCDVPATLTNALAIAAGGYHSVAINANCTVTAWGADDSGQTEVSANLASVIGISAGTWHSLALRADGSVAAWGDNSLGQTNLPPGLSNVVAIVAGGNHNLALQADGTVAAWGENTDASGNFAGQSVVPGNLTNVVAIGAGEYHSLAVKADGSVVIWGDNSGNQSTVPLGLPSVAAIAGGASHTAALGFDGTVIAWGSNGNQQCQLPAGLPPAVGIAAGSYHTLVLLEGVVPAPRLLNPAFKGGRFIALVQSLNRKTYALEFKDSLVTTNWTAGPGVPGNGALRLLTDPTATGTQRFYRARWW